MLFSPAPVLPLYLQKPKFLKFEFAENELWKDFWLTQEQAQKQNF